MSKKKIIPVGTRFGSLVVIGVGEDYIQPSNNSHHSTSICLCDCGNTKTITNSDLKKGHCLSCGCMKKEYIRKANIKHGEKGTRLYNIWQSMKQRCLLPTNANYKYYGQRGICVCSEWLDYINFAQWARNNGYQDDLTIERIDVDGNYCPENCKWATIQEQNNNKTTTHNISYNGETHTLKQWSKILNISYSTLERRLHILGWSVEDALTKPVDTSKRNHKYNK